MRPFFPVLALSVALAAAACTSSTPKDDTDTDVVDTDVVDTDVVDTDVVDTDVTVVPTCADWCSTVMSACTGDNIQFPGDIACRTFCAESGIAVGTADDASGNTIGCRTWHAGVAAAGDAAAKTAHCPHAGAYGGGVCGDEVENFCEIDLHVCADGNAVYESLSACTTVASTWAAGLPTDQAGDSLGCREYHLGAAMVSPADHCPHTAADGGGVCVSP